MAAERTHRPEQGDALGGVNDARTNRYYIHISYVVLGICVFSIYLFMQKKMFSVDRDIIPQGDAFTYTMFLFHVINKSHENMAVAFQYILHSENFTWLQDFLVLLFSPFLYNQRGSLIFINFCCFFLSIAVILRTIQLSGVTPVWAFIVALLFAGLPWNFNPLMAFNLSSLMPEPIFVGMFISTILLLCWFTANPYSKITAAAVGFALGATIWSRGNAFVYLAMPLAGFVMVAVVCFGWSKWRLNTRVLINLSIIVFICSIMASVYFYFTYHTIYAYYFGEGTAVMFDFSKKVAGSKWIILNVPGLALAGKWYHPYADGSRKFAIVLTILSHIIVLYSAFTSFKKLQSTDEKQVLIGSMGAIGATVFYLYMLFAILTFSGFDSDPRVRELHPFEPAFAGFICCALSVLCTLFSHPRIPRLHHGILYIAAGASFMLSAWEITSSNFNLIEESGDWNVQKFVENSSNEETACTELNQFNRIYIHSDDLKQISLMLARDSSRRFVFFFWYGLFNNQIAEYYASQENMIPPQQVPPRSTKDQYFWMITFNPELLTPEPAFHEYLNYILARATFLVIPEQLDVLTSVWPSAVVAYRRDIAAAINSQEAPDYGVWGVIDEPRGRILILKRRDPHTPDDGLETLPRTWGSPTQVIGRDFKGAHVVPQKSSWQAYAGAFPHVLYTYKNYAVFQLGEAYIGIAKELGSLAINDVIASNKSRLLGGKLIAAREPASLQAAIDACSAR